MIRRVAALLAVVVAVAEGNMSQTLFERYGDAIFQIKTVDKASGSQRSIGSGFLVGDGLVVTNYHVIAAAEAEPARRQIMLEREGGKNLKLTLLHLDVINDIALLGVEDKQALASVQALTPATETPQQGEDIYSLGNPLDIGISVIPGTYNGVAEEALLERVHFSGAVNPGMSGGPVLNADGVVVGINVASAGNQIGFLVPVKFLAALLARYQQEQSPTDFAEEKRRQLAAHQRRMMDAVLTQPWKTEDVAGGRLYGEIAPFFECWGNSEHDKKRKLREISKGCGNKVNIYLGDGFTTGAFLYQFILFEGDDISPTRFYHYYSERIRNAVPDNRATSSDVTNYRCADDVIATTVEARDTATRSFFCVRAYKNYPGLHDIFYVGANISEDNKALFSHFTVAGVEKEAALAFLEKFIGGIGWL